VVRTVVEAGRGKSFWDGGVRGGTPNFEKRTKIEALLTERDGPPRSFFGGGREREKSEKAIPPLAQQGSRAFHLSRLRFTGRKKADQGFN